MAIQDWLEKDRPREKLLRQGADSLSDAELLAIFLRTGVPGKSAVLLANEALEKAGGLRSLLDQDQRSFCRLKGLGTVKFIQIKAALELGARYLAAPLQDKDLIQGAKAARDYLSLRFSGLTHEVFGCFFLDSQCKLIECSVLFQGTLDQAAVYPREVVRKALDLSCAYVILFHNHPSGQCTPSESDKLITERLKKALALVDIQVVDHIIVGASETFSFAEYGLI